MRNRKLVFAVISLILFAVIFYVDTVFLPTDIQLLVPYLIIASAATIFIGPKTGLTFSSLSIVLWLASKTQNFSKSQAAVYVDFFIKVLFIFGMYALMLFVRRIMRENERLLLSDELTGVASRRGFFHLANFETKRRIAKGNYLSVFYIDIDNFKTVNDTLGHEIGDKVLREFADCVRRATRPSDIFGRLGGDEFALLLSNVTSAEVNLVSRRIMANFKAVSKSNEWPTTLSIGIYSTEAKKEIGELIRSADELMYEAKQKGKNQIAQNKLGAFAAQSKTAIA